MVYNPSDVHLDRMLTNFSVGITNNELIGERLIPSIPVAKQSDLYYRFNHESWKPMSDIRAPATEAAEIPGLTFARNPYYCHEHALRTRVSDEERANADSPITPDTDATELVKNRVMLVKEREIAALVQNGVSPITGATFDTYDAGLTASLTGNNRWDMKHDDNTPIDDLEVGMREIHKRLFREPNVGVFPYQVMHHLTNTQQFVDRVKYTRVDTRPKDLLASLVGIRRILVPAAGYDKAPAGQLEDLGYIWGNHVALLYVAPRPGKKQPTFAYQFKWRNNNLLAGVYRWREQKTKSDLIQYGEYYDIKIISVKNDETEAGRKSIAGYLIKDVIS